jgi:hypothetical protein
MNIAFSAFIITIFLFPGVIFLHGYYKGDWSNSLSGRSFTEKIISGLIASLVIHFIFYWVYFIIYQIINWITNSIWNYHLIPKVEFATVFIILNVKGHDIPQ